MEDYTLLRERWNEIVERLSHMFTEGETLDVDAIIYLIGIQELGQLGRKYEKDEKLDLMHIAICKLLEPFGYYQYQFTDPAGEQTILMKKAIVQYFVERDFFEN